MSFQRPEDLAPEEQRVHRVLSAVPPVAPPLGFRSSVLRRIGAERRSPFELPIALALAVPSLAYLIWATAAGGADIALALENVFAVAGGASEDAFFAVDGLLVLAIALLGLGSLVGTHALLATDERPRP